MRRGFVNGLVAGSLLGAMVGLMVLPQGKKSARRYVGKSRNMVQRSGKVLDRLSDNMRDWLD